ncbi:MAG TPA: hypothetical protein DCY46_02015 [Lactobacillus sp.]|nr:hypothetical protein [Lactobacillus sp.]
MAKYLQDPHVDERINKMNLMMGESDAMPGIFQAIDTVYGSFAAFWRDALRLSDQDLADLKHHYLE